LVIKLKICHVSASLQSVQCVQQSTCQHPSFDLDLIDPVLNEEDVPDAKLDLTNLAKYRKDHLIRWLACRGLRTEGYKEELVKR